MLLPGVYDTTGLPAGNHQYKIIGENSRGEGEASPVATIPVALAAAA